MGNAFGSVIYFGMAEQSRKSLGLRRPPCRAAWAGLLRPSVRKASTVEPSERDESAVTKRAWLSRFRKTD